MWQYLTQILEGQVALAGMVAAAVIVFAPPIEKANPAAVLFGIAGVGLVLPPLLTGHSASASGHDLAMTSLSIHVLAASLWIGGLAGVLVAPLINIHYEMGLLLTLKGFAAAILGGLTSPFGAIFGGVLLGLVESTAIVMVSSGYKDVVAMSLLIIIMIAMPQGLFGRRGRQGG